MTRDELADWWRLYVRTLAGLLELVEGAGAAAPPDALQQLQQLQREALFLHIRCGPPAAARAGPPASALLGAARRRRERPGQVGDAAARTVCGAASPRLPPRATRLPAARPDQPGAGLGRARARRAAVTNANSVKHFVARGVVDASAAVPDAPSSPAGWYPVRARRPGARALTLRAHGRVPAVARVARPALATGWGIPL
jgi:hypothetical protein